MARSTEPLPATVKIRYFTKEEAAADPRLMEMARKQRNFGMTIYRLALEAGYSLFPEEVDS